MPDPAKTAPAKTDHRQAETIVLPARGWRIDPRHAWTAGILCWIGFALVSWLVHSGRAAAIDAAGLTVWRSNANLRPASPLWVIEAVRDLTALGGVLLRVLFSLAALAALLFLRMRREAILLLATLVSGLLVESAIKALVGRPRPQIVPHLTEAAGMSFPSGHSFNAALGFIAVALAFATFSARRSVRWTIIGSAMAISLLVAWSRVWLGVHFPTDVIAGWLGGAGWAFLAAALLYQPAKAAADASA
ncbi:MAG: phosphatase family protein [Novosphingobium sp.]|nr:phosphatase family protein [Novosphingobium sp.]